jgi:hypothetical protein
MEKYINSLIKDILTTKAKKATRFVSPKEIIRAVRTSYKGKTGKKGFDKGNIEITLTIGKPNYAERDFIKICLKAKQKFPLHKNILKF